MDQQTMGWVLLGAAVLILALLIYLLTQVKKLSLIHISEPTRPY